VAFLIRMKRALQVPAAESTTILDIFPKDVWNRILKQHNLSAVVNLALVSHRAKETLWSCWVFIDTEEAKVPVLSLLRLCLFDKILGLQSPIPSLENHFQSLSSMTMLQHLKLYDGTLTEGMVATISNLTTLRSLVLCDVSLSRQGKHGVVFLSTLTSLTSLTKISLCGSIGTHLSLVQNTMTSLLSKLPNLEYIDLTQTKILDDNCLALLNVPKLKTVNFTYCTGVSRVGMASMVLRMTSLQHIRGPWDMFTGDPKAIRPEINLDRHMPPQEFDF